MEDGSINNKVKLSILRACEEYELIESGDKIMVGLSGGKDSLTLVHFLSQMAERLNHSFKVIAAHIRFTNLPYAIDADYLSNFCKERNVEYHLIEDQIRDGHMGNGTCLHCSRFRRAKLMELARVFQCNKLSLGHHLDDIVATLLMNMTQHGRFAGMAVKLNITVGDEKYPLQIIRPLALTSEQSIIDFVTATGMQPVKCRCPWGDTGVRKKTRSVVDNIAQALGEDARINIFKSQFNVSPKRIFREKTMDIEDIGAQLK